MVSFFFYLTVTLTLLCIFRWLINSLLKKWTLKCKCETWFFFLREPESDHHIACCYPFFYFTLVKRFSFTSAFSSLADNQWSKSMKETCRIQRKSRRLRSDRTAVRSIGPDYRSSPTHFGHRFARCAVNAAAYPVARVNQVKNRETRGKGRRVGSAGRSQTFPVLRFPISRFLVARRKLRLKFSMKRLLLHE